MRKNMSLKTPEKATSADCMGQKAIMKEMKRMNEETEKHCTVSR